MWVGSKPIVSASCWFDLIYAVWVVWVGLIWLYAVWVGLKPIIHASCWFDLVICGVGWFDLVICGVGWT